MKITRTNSPHDPRDSERIDSREIAKHSEKHHDDIIVEIEEMLEAFEEAGDDPSARVECCELRYERGVSKQPQKYFLLNEVYATTLVSGWDVPLCLRMGKAFDQSRSANAKIDYWTNCLAVLRDLAEKENAQELESKREAQELSVRTKAQHNDACRRLIEALRTDGADCPQCGQFVRDYRLVEPMWKRYGLKCEICESVLGPEDFRAD